jgi:hypothetical protein
LPQSQAEERALPLTSYERRELDDWVEQYEFKYNVVGTLKGWDPKVLDGLGDTDTQAPVVKNAEGDGGADVPSRSTTVEDTALGKNGAG